MLWCPKCRTEYREEFTECSDCGAMLVGELPAEDKTFEDFDTAALLVTASDLMQADILESKMKFYGIPVMRKNRESGDYLAVYMGATPFGIDLYVPSKLLDKARVLLSEETEPAIDTSNNITNTENDMADDLREAAILRRKRSRNLIYWVFIIPGIIILLIYYIKDLINK